MKSSYAKAGIVSALVSLFVVFANAIFFAQATTYEPGIAAAELESLKYSEAVALLESRAHPAHGFGAFLDSAGSLWFWQNLLISWAVLAGICFVCCLLFSRWSRRAAGA
jgi:hypothetical protein